MKIIGISGLAGDGKDSVCDIFEKFFSDKNYGFDRVALADELKQECKKACLALFGVDPTCCSREEKEKIRNYLVFYGKVWRENSKGEYWTARALRKIKKNRRRKMIFCVPDIRHASYDNDECQWVKNNGGILVHVRKFSFKDQIVPYKGFRSKRMYSRPVNQEEKVNDPKVKRKADFILEWPDISPANPHQNDECVNATKEVAKRIFDTFTVKK